MVRPQSRTLSSCHKRTHGAGRDNYPGLQLQTGSNPPQKSPAGFSSFPQEPDSNLTMESDAVVRHLIRKNGALTLA